MSARTSFLRLHGHVVVVVDGDDDANQNPFWVMRERTHVACVCVSVCINSNIATHAANARAPHKQDSKIDRFWRAGWLQKVVVWLTVSRGLCGSIRDIRAVWHRYKHTCCTHTLTRFPLSRGRGNATRNGETANLFGLIPILTGTSRATLVEENICACLVTVCAPCNIFGISRHIPQTMWPNYLRATRGDVAVPVEFATRLCF